MDNDTVKTHVTLAIINLKQKEAPYYFDKKGVGQLLFVLDDKLNESLCSIFGVGSGGVAPPNDLNGGSGGGVASASSSGGVGGGPPGGLMVVIGKSKIKK